jgi:hypothetical protein
VFYPAQELFGHYLYQSGTSRTLNEYFRWLAESWSKSLPSDARVLDIASNDGAFLDAIKKLRRHSEGVEPATNLVAVSRQKGHQVTEAFWPSAAITGPFDGIIAMNVLAHTPSPAEFLTRVREVLAPSGVALMQTSQVDMFQNAEFDTLYHEHYSFFCPSSMEHLARRSGFTVSAFLKADIHGGSLIGVLGNDADAVDRTVSALSSPPFFVRQLSAGDRPTQAEAQAFGANAQRTCSSVRALGQMAREGGRQVVLVGVAAKAVTVLQAAHLQIDRVVDEAPLKIGRYLPGTDLLIEPLDAISEISGPCLFVIGAWNFAQELRAKIRSRRSGGDLWCTYFPSVTVDAV